MPDKLLLVSVPAGDAGAGNVVFAFNESSRALDAVFPRHPFCDLGAWLVLICAEILHRVARGNFLLLLSPLIAGKLRGSVPTR